MTSIIPQLWIALLLIASLFFVWFGVASLIAARKFSSVSLVYLGVGLLLSQLNVLLGMTPDLIDGRFKGILPLVTIGMLILFLFKGPKELRQKGINLRDVLLLK